MKRRMIGFLLAAALGVSAAPGRTIDFTKGRVKNFTTVKVQDPAWTAEGLTGAGKGGRLIGSRLGIAAERIDRLELTAGGVRKAVLYFDADGKNFAETKKLHGIIAPDGRVIFSPAGKKTWQGTIDALRFDLTPEGETFTVKQLAFREKVPGVPGDVDFTLGAALGWRVIGAKEAACKAPGGIAVNAERSFRLFSPPLDMDAAKADVVEVQLRGGRMRTTKLYFAAAGEDFSENRMVRGIVEGDTIIFNLYQCPRFKGIFGALRMDVTPDAPGTAEIRGIRFRKSDGSSALRSPWRRPTKIGAGQTLCGECELRHPAPVKMTVETAAPLTLALTRFSIYGEELGQETYEFKPGRTVADVPVVPRAATMKLAVRNPGSAPVDFTVKMSQWPPAAARKGREVFAAAVTNLPERTDENTVWTPEIGWQGNFPAGRHLVVRLRDERGVTIIAADQMLDDRGPARLPQLTLRHLSPGRYQLSAEVDGVPVRMPEQRFLHERHSPVKPPVVAVHRNDGHPYYMINGTEVAEAMEYLMSDPPLSLSAYRQIFHAVDHGIRSIRLRVIFRFTPEGGTDFRELDGMLQTVLLRAPEVNVMLHTSVTDPGPRWRENHPEEGIRDEKGEFRILNYRATPEATSSMASRKWREDSQARLRELIGHLGDLPGGERVIGVLPCAGITWEWIHWGSARGVMVDYSEHYARYFRGYLRRVYRDDIAALNAAWQSEFRSFDDVPIPRPERRKAADRTEYRSPEKFQPEIDLTESLAALIADIIADLCHTVKDASGGRLLSGTYYGYTIYLNSAFRAQNSGHFALTRLLKSPDVDILTAPSRYAGRQIGGATGFMFPEGSVNLHGKLIISECDDRPINADNGNGRADTVAGSRAVFERAYGLQNSAGAVMRWFDFSKGWVMNEPRLLDVVSALSRYDAAVRRNGVGAMPDAATAAVLVSERTAAVLNPDSRLQMMLLENGYRDLAASGMSFRMFDVSDLAAVAANRQLLVFVNCQRLSEAEKAAVRAAVPGRTILVTSGIGIFADGKLDTAFQRELFGVDFRYAPDRVKLSCRATPEMEKMFGIPAGTEFRTAAECGDIFYPTGPDVIPLAVTSEGDAAIAAVRRDGNLRLYCAHPVLPPVLLRGIAAGAGLPVIRADGAAVWYGGGHGCVHTAAAVTATAELPPGCLGVVEYPDGKFLPAVSGRVTKSLPAVSTWLFSLKK
ncbi:MAG: beta-galactosidase [Lentisphaeria bacterium]|nr:beta-galactosidase [Lentisphaeria bacterium]